MSPLTFAMSTATGNLAQTSSYLIPGQHFLETFMLLSYNNQDHTFMVTTSFLSLTSKHDFCYTYGDAYSAQIFNNPRL